MLGWASSGRRPAEIGERLLGGLITLRGILDREPINHAGQVGRHAVEDGRNGRQLAIGRGVPHHPGDLPVAAESLQARKEVFELLRPTEQLVGGEAERVEVAFGTRRVRTAARPARRHVARRALEITALVVGDAAGQAEIAELDAAVLVEQQVGRLDIAVNHVVRMQERQGVERADESGAEDREVDRLAAGGIEQRTVHQFEHQPAAGPDDVVDREDVRVLQGREELRLAPESLQPPLVVHVLAVNLLDGHVAAQLAVAGAIDGGEIAIADQVQDFVAVSGLHSFSVRDSVLGQKDCQELGKLLVAALGAREALELAAAFGAEEAEDVAISLPLCREVAAGMGLLGFAEQDLIRPKLRGVAAVVLGQLAAGGVATRERPIAARAACTGARTRRGPCWPTRPGRRATAERLCRRPRPFRLEWHRRVEARGACRPRRELRPAIERWRP